MGRNFDKFLLLMWKNWLLQWRHPIQTVVEILAPVLFSALLVVIRSLVDPDTYEARLYSPYNPLTPQALNQFSVAYSPTNPHLEQIMNLAINHTGLVRVLSYDSGGEMAYALESLTEQVLAGVQFDDSLLGNEELPRNLSCAIRFPAELRSQFINDRLNWRTNLLFPPFQLAGPREPSIRTTASPYYYDQGFLSLQLAIAKGFVQFVREDAPDPQIMMQRFPYPSWISDPMLQALESFVGIVIMLSFIYTCINTVNVVTVEKEHQLKESMKIMGLPNWLHWTAWFLKTFMFLLISVILMVILLKVSWYPDTDVSVFTLADSFVVFLFLVCYICAVITFCFMISVFFSKASTAAAIAGFAWFLSYAPYFFLQTEYSNLSLGVKMVTSLLCNTAMAFGFQILLMFEGTGEGVQWHNLFKPVSTDDTFTLGYVMLMLLLDSLIYLLIALYVEAVFPGDYGVPQVWYFPFTPSFWCGKPHYSGIEDKSEPTEGNEFFEDEPRNLPAGIQIRNLRKEFGKKAAVRGLSLNMYENQITVLLGHNGAGKTTTMSMLTGMFPPTTGTALVGGFNIRRDMDKVRDSLGLCPQHNILFDELTVKEHLYFFCKLKGVRQGIQEEIQRYIELLELVPKTNTMSKALSGGMKRKLSVGVALCGGSRVVMLDEPTAGIDPSARRALWDLLQQQKFGRTILLTTHFMDEADLLGDRIAIMAGGQLQCCGSSFFLKKKYGTGYRLIMDKLDDCDPAKVTNLLRKYIPNLDVESNVGSELSYALNENQSTVFEEMLKDLENNGPSLGIKGYGISLTTLEEVFMKVGADHGQEEALNELEQTRGNDTNSNGFTNNQYKDYSSSDANLHIGDNLLTGMALKKNQILAMFMKKALATWRTWNMFLIQLLLPVWFIVINFIVMRSFINNSDLPELQLTLDSYDNPITVVNGSNMYKARFLEELRQENHIFVDWENEDLSANILQKGAEDIAAVRNRYMIGATFNEDDSLTVWYNNQPYHTPPLALAMATKTIIKELLGDDYDFDVTNFPLPNSLEALTETFEFSTVGFNIAFNLGFSMAFIPSFYILFYVRERKVKSKHLQFVSGVNVYTFWFTAYIWDILTFILTAVVMIITFAAFQEDGYKTAGDLGRLFVLLVCFGYSVIPLQYIGSHWFKVPATGFVRMTLLGVVIGCAPFLTVEVLSMTGLNLEHIAEVLDWIFLVLPHYCLCNAASNMYKLFSTYNTCQIAVDRCVEIIAQSEETCWIVACAALPNACCDVETNHFIWNAPGIGRNIFFFMMTGTVLFVLLLIIELGAFKRLMYAVRKTNAVPPVDVEHEDSDVKEEREKIMNSTRTELDQNTLVLRDVSKYYGKFLAVNRISLGIKRYECFGLLGINGAGKTSTFKMMTGDIPISHGDAWINGLNLKKDIKQAHKLMGYCPQFDALLDDLTGYETMIMFGLLRGIPFEESKVVAVNLSRDFDFHRHLHKQVKEYSGGNKRKLSTAIALIGDPPVIFLDEPTTGMDPATKRYLWNVLCKIRDSGKCIVLTSHSMEECEALCTRLAIMVNGTFRCLGSTQHLKNKFSEGYTLTIKTKKGVDALAETEQVEKFVMDNFPGAILREKHQELLTYHIMSRSHAWSTMFGIMERGKNSLNIEDYSIGQSNLEQVFLTFTKTQWSL